jgi:hypothetical protein
VLNSESFQSLPKRFYRVQFMSNEVAHGSRERDRERERVEENESLSMSTTIFIDMYIRFIIVRTS